MNRIKPGIENLIWLLVCALLTLLVALRCWKVPFSHDEVATFHFYIQPGEFVPFLAHPDANGHFLMSATAWLSYSVFGSSPLALRVPCILAFVVLCYACWRFRTLFKTWPARILPAACFLLSYNFISFYALCRGYGLSMSFLLLSLFYLYDFTRSLRQKSFYKFLVFSQLALAANLTLVFVVLLCLAIMLLVQYINKKSIGKGQITGSLVFLIITGFWIRYAFFLKDAGALYYGEGDSYWQVTFSTLLETIFFKATWLEWTAIAVFLCMCLYFGYTVFKHGLRISNSFQLPFSIFIVLLVFFWLLKKVLHVNYPEDRAALFFYVFFVLALAFMCEEVKPILRPVYLILPFLFISHFLMNMNLQVHCWRNYETVPQSFFDELVKEQQNRSERITIAGNRVREFFYGFMNFNSQEKLNHITSPEALQMNADYAIAYRGDEPWYKGFYDVMQEEPFWGFVLLKRNKQLRREQLFTQEGLYTEGKPEYFNLLDLNDLKLETDEPLYAEADLAFANVPSPFQAWLVLEADPADGSDDRIFVRTPLQLVRQDFSQQRVRLGNLSGKVPKNIKRLVFYIWNIKQENYQLTIHSARLFQVKGAGVNLISESKL